MKPWLRLAIQLSTRKRDYHWEWTTTSTGGLALPGAADLGVTPRYVIASTVIHIGLVAALFGLMAVPPSWIAQLLPWTNQSDTEIAFSGGGIEGVHFVPFEGVSYSKFISKQYRMERDQAQLHDLLTTLSRSGSTSKKSAVVAEGNLAGDSKIDEIPQAAAPEIDRKAIETPKKIFAALKPAAAPAAPSPITEADRMQVTERMRQIGSGLKQLYSRLLVADRSLSGSVQFEARVTGAGTLRLTRLTPRGSFDTNSINAIHQYLNTSMSQVAVNKKLEGMLVRGEHILTQ